MLSGGGHQNGLLGGFFVGEFFKQFMVVHYEYTVGHVYKLRKVGGYHYDNGALFGKLPHVAVKLGLDAHVDACGGFVQKQYLKVAAGGVTTEGPWFGDG